jgi:glycosyltransferase involved in cell wall biosynthesis
MRMVHFVTGGFSGATQVAVDLALAAQQQAGHSVLLVLRKKRNTSAEKVQALRAQGLQVEVVPSWSHTATVWALYRLFKTWQPDVLFAHGFSDHIWGRMAGKWAQVALMLHVEHNSRERYTAWRRQQSAWLESATACHIGVSEGVRQSLIDQGFPAEKCVAIPNGVDLERFPAELVSAPWSQREAAVLMASRFARQKDQCTLIEAMAILRQRGVHVALQLAGGGKERLRAAAQQQVQSLGLQSQVQFLGNVADLPKRLAQTQIFVLSTHYEGMPLALVEAMAAGCACIGSDVVGVREVIDHGQTGLLVPHANPTALADALYLLLQEPAQAAALGAAARRKVLSSWGRQHMLQGYAALVQRLQTDMARS